MAGAMAVDLPRISRARPRRPAAVAARLMPLLRDIRWLLPTLVVAGLSSARAQQLLTGHSITVPDGGPPDLSSLGRDWWLAGVTIPAQTSLVLSPGVPGREGLIWSLTPLLTNDFEISAVVKAKNIEQRNIPKADGFAIWYVYENATEALYKLTETHIQNQEELKAGTWSAEGLIQGFDTYAYRRTFDGLAVFCSDFGEHPGVKLVANDGKKSVENAQAFTDGVKMNFLDGKEYTIKLRVTPKGARMEIVGPDAKGDMEIKGEMKQGGYIGISAISGRQEHYMRPIAPSLKSSFIELTKLQVNNYDKNAKGEEKPQDATLPPAVATEDKQDVLREASSFKDLREESDAIKELTNMVFKLVAEANPMRQQMTKAIESLGKRVSVMEKTFADLKVELDRSTGHKLGSEFEDMKAQLASLSTDTSKESQERHQRLESLHSDIVDIHKTAHSSDSIDKHLEKLSESNNKVIDKMASEHRTMFGGSLFAIAFVLVAGLSLYNKFRCWEKKHCL